MPPVGFEPTTSAGERPQIYALDRAATGIGYRENAWNVKVLPRYESAICPRRFAKYTILDVLTDYRKLNILGGYAMSAGEQKYRASFNFQ